MKRLFLFSLIFLLTVAHQNAYAQVSVQDSLALVDLYNSTNGSSWTDTTN